MNKIREFIQRQGAINFNNYNFNQQNPTHSQNERNVAEILADLNEKKRKTKKN